MEAAVGRVIKPKLKSKMALVVRCDKYFKAMSDLNPKNNDHNEIKKKISGCGYN